MNDYELVLILSPKIESEILDATIDNLVTKYVIGGGGTISDIERWGNKRLAYPIKHFTEGNYILARFKLEPALSKELEANLRINEQVLRHLLIKAGS